MKFLYFIKTGKMTIVDCNKLHKIKYPEQTLKQNLYKRIHSKTPDKLKQSSKIHSSNPQKGRKNKEEKRRTKETENKK